MKLLDKVNKKDIAILCIAILILILVLNNVISIPCLFYKFTGLHCSGCGITRMLKELVKLNFYQAFRYNPLCFILFPFIFSYLIYDIYIHITDKENKIIKKINPKFLYLIIFLLIIFGILRNIPLFSWLAPTKI